VELGGQLAPDRGWLNAADATDVCPAVLCVFPDLSVIDAWGLAYHTMGTIRGVDLEPLFRWKPESWADDRSPSPVEPGEGERSSAQALRLPAEERPQVRAAERAHGVVRQSLGVDD
jgi:hypothetical protein